MKLQLAILATAILSIFAGEAVAQKRPIPVCTEAAFAAFRPLPKMEYECPQGLIESDDKILKLPERLAAIRSVMGKLEAFTNPAWWQADIDDLNACEIHGSAGKLTDDETQRWKSGDYSFELLGNHQMRLALLADPCYQTGYNGANTFFLYRKGGKVYVTQVLNGYYSRVDDSIGIDFANLNGQQVIEISTANNMPPSLLNYYFVVDAKTHKALPKRLFKDGNKLTNQIYSAMLMNEPGDLGLPKNASELRVISNNHLAPTFSAYKEDDDGKIDSNGRKLSRIIYRWNGRFYLVQSRKR
jgi:hypothetical protein